MLPRQSMDAFSGGEKSAEGHQKGNEFSRRMRGAHLLWCCWLHQLGCPLPPLWALFDEPPVLHSPTHWSPKFRSCPSSVRVNTRGLPGDCHS